MGDALLTLLDLSWRPFYGCYTFGHYVPFLALLFGISLLFGAWDGFYGKLYETSSAQAKEDEEEWAEASEDAAELDISIPADEKGKLEKKRRWNTRVREGIKIGGRYAGRLTAGSIALAFFFVPRELTIPGYIATSILIAAGLPIFALFFMWRNSKGLEKIREKQDSIYGRAMHNSRAMKTADVSIAEESIRRTPPPTRGMGQTRSWRQF